MEEYRRQVRMSVTAARGIVDPLLVDGRDHSLDTAVVKLSVAVLPRAQMTAFYFAFHCQQTWEAIRALFETEVRKEVQLESVQRYGREAIKTLRDKAAKSKLLDAWEAAYRQKRREQ